MDVSGILSIEDLKKAVIGGRNLKFVYFWQHEAGKDRNSKQCLSQWFPAKFTKDGFTYHSAEQYMMAQKALLFCDEEMFKQILIEKQLKVIKECGRKVRSFNEEVWQKNRFQIVYDGNYAKFSQNEDLKQFLISTNKKILVEASPYDKIWGIGLSESDPDIENIKKWKGLNLLGFALMKVRNDLSEF